MVYKCMQFLVVFFNDTATTEIYTLSLHDALPICADGRDEGGVDRRGHTTSRSVVGAMPETPLTVSVGAASAVDRKSTRLNSSHANISYAVFCLKKKTTRALIIPDLRPRHNGYAVT